MTIPIELVIVDAVNTISLALGGVFLLKFLKNFGSEKMKKYSFFLAGSIILYAIIHEGLEVLHGLRDVNAGFAETAVTTVLSLTYLAASIQISGEIKSMLYAGGKKHGM